MCTPPQVATQCPNPIPANAGCKGAEDCGPDGSGNGLDDNCNGLVDESCACRPAPSRSASSARPGVAASAAAPTATPPARAPSSARGARAWARSARRRRTATSSTTTATAATTTGCAARPASTARRPAIRASRRKPPYTDVPLKGELFFPGAATSWSWKIVGGPCDQLFATTTRPARRRRASRSPAPTPKTPIAHFTLSGDYTVTLTVVGADGVTYTCTWVQHIIGPGVRFELCWDHSGPPTTSICTCTSRAPRPTGSPRRHRHQRRQP